MKPRITEISGSRQAWRYVLFSLLWGWVVWAIVQEFFDPMTGDFTHEIYFGQRVLLGDLPWTDEYFDKLPASQIFMALPSLLGGITAWRVISLTASALTAAIILWRLPVILAHEMGLSARRGWSSSHLMVVLYFTMMTAIPGGFTSMNSISASLTMGASVALYSDRYETPSRVSWNTLAFSGLALALAISLRPYFFPVFLVLAVWVGFSSSRGRSWSLRNIASNPGVGVFFWTGAGGLLMNVGPYLFLGEFPAFLDGISAVGGATRPDFTLKATLFLTLSALFALVTGIYFSSRRKYPLGTFFSLSVVALTAIISSQHFWNHYVAFYAWYFAGIVALMLTIWSSKLKSPAEALGSKWSRKRAVLAASLLVSVGSAAALQGALFREPPPSRAFDYVTNVTWLNQHYGRANVSFIAPREMHAHWVFSESRVGLPGGQALSAIKDGNWESKQQFASFKLPRNVEEYCSIIQASGVRFVLVRSYHLPESCFTSPAGENWTKLSVQTGPGWSGDVDVWENPQWG